jgi:hypothetical protein
VSYLVHQQGEQQQEFLTESEQTNKHGLARPS